MRAATGDGAPSPSRLQHDFRPGTMNEVTARTTKTKRVTRLQRLKYGVDGLARPQRSTKLGKSRNYRTSLRTPDYGLGGLATALDGVGKIPLISSL
jgi:hypothetical protein